MKYNPDIHRRRSIRLKKYNYSRSNAYFVTICVQNRECLLGNIINNKVSLSELGKLVEKNWNKLIQRFTNINLDSYVVMPNHFHGIIIINPPNQPTISSIMGAFKSITTKEYIQGIQDHHWPDFEGRIWQKNYYEHIIRDEKSLEILRNYIRNNPSNWKEDKLFIEQRIGQEV